MTRIGIFEGTFNPPHNGHVLSARAFMEQMWLDFLYVLPMPIVGEREADTAHRLRMCEAAFGGAEGVYVSDAAIKNASFSTSGALRELFADERRLFLLCGTDRMLALREERDVAEIFQYAYPVYVRREKDPMLDRRIVKQISAYQEAYGKVMRRIVTEPTVISSEEIRERVRVGKPIGDCVPPTVEKYIGDNHLYV